MHCNCIEVDMIHCQEVLGSEYLRIGWAASSWRGGDIWRSQRTKGSRGLRAWRRCGCCQKSNSRLSGYRFEYWGKGNGNVTSTTRLWRSPSVLKKSKTLSNGIKRLEILVINQLHIGGTSNSVQLGYWRLENSHLCFQRATGTNSFRYWLICER